MIVTQSPLNPMPHPSPRRWDLALRGVFAGNIFDLGAANSAQLYADNGASSSFTATRASLVTRPWARDDLDAMLGTMCGAGGMRYRKALMFV